MEDGLPGTLVTDNMAAFLMKSRPLHACVVGADRIALNGDTANKIGTTIRLLDMSKREMLGRASADRNRVCRNLHGGTLREGTRSALLCCRSDYYP